MAKTIIKFSKIAEEKLKEIVNGSKAEVKEFFDNIDNYMEKKEYKLIFKGSKKNFYYKKCKNVYLMFFIMDKNTIGIIDILIETEFNKLRKQLD